MAGSSRSPHEPPRTDEPVGRQVHPCAGPLAFWTICFAFPVLVAILGKSPAWALLGIPSLAWMTLLGAKISRGLPTVGAAETQRLDQMLIEVGGVDAFGVVAQDQIDSPVALRRGSQPRVYAARDFVHAASDNILGGVAALQHAAWRIRSCSDADVR
jgi:hypothetical protein